MGTWNLNLAYSKWSAYKYLLPITTMVKDWEDWHGLQTTKLKILGLTKFKPFNRHCAPLMQRKVIAAAVSERGAGGGGGG